MSDEPIVSISNLSLNGSNNSFSVGDKVKINVNVEVFKQMQEGHGGWNQKMADVSIFKLHVKLFQILFLF